MPSRTSLTQIMKRNDLLPPLTVTCTYRDGTIVDLSAATSPKFYMRDVAVPDGTAVKVDGTATILDGGTTGQIRYSWSGDDTDTAGEYAAEFEVSIGGKTITFPSGSELRVIVKEDLA